MKKESCKIEYRIRCLDYLLSTAVEAFKGRIAPSVKNREV